MDAAIDTRPTQPADREFLLGLYASTRAEELAGWSPAQAGFFVQMQFDAQDRSWRQRFPNAEFLLVLVDGEPAGRLYLERSGDGLLIVDLTILPGYRRRGIGGRLVAGVLAEADRSGSVVRLHVAIANPAQAFWEQFGFRPVSQDEAYILMQRPQVQRPQVQRPQVQRPQVQRPQPE